MAQAALQPIVKLIEDLLAAQRAERAQLLSIVEQLVPGNKPSAPESDT